MIGKKSVVLLLVLMFLPLVAAYSYGGYYGFSPDQVFESEWTKFFVAFVFFYAIIFFAMRKSFENERSVAVVISAVVSFLISYALWERGYLDFNYNSELLDLIIFLAILIVAFLFLRMIYVRSSKVGAVIAVLAIWPIVSILYYYEFVPVYVLPDVLRWMIELTASWVGLILVILIAAIVGSMKKEKDRGVRIHFPRD